MCGAAGVTFNVAYDSKLDPEQQRATVDVLKELGVDTDPLAVGQTLYRYLERSIIALDFSSAMQRITTRLF